MTPWITKPVPFNIGQGAAAAPLVTIECKQLEYDNYVNLKTDGDYGVATQLCDSLLGENITSVGIQFRSEGSATSGTISCCRWANTTALDQANAADLLSAANHTFWTADVTAVGDTWYTPASQSASDATLANDLIGVVMTGSGSTDKYVGREDTNPTPSKKTYKMRANTADEESFALSYNIQSSS